MTIMDDFGSVQSNDDGLADVDEFFVEGADHSKVKTTIATKYFATWAGIIGPQKERIGYIDFYAGAGRFKDGTNSTPLLILERAIADPQLRAKLVTYFNDGKPAHAKSLSTAINAMPGITMLKYAPKIYTNKVGPATATFFASRPIIPTFAFIDPYGYKGLSLGLVHAVLKDWACECLFFLNYNRINAGINNPKVATHMDALFGAARLATLRSAIVGVSPADRERMILAALTEALRALGGKFALPYRFKMADADRTSHYLIFVGKHFLGYKIMREVMAKASTTRDEGVASFEYNPHPPMFVTDGRSVAALSQELITAFPGRALTVKQIFELHSPGKLYILRNYQDALMRLEGQGRVTPSKPASERPAGTLAQHILITFPRAPLSGGAPMASRPTSGRPASGLQPSASARPTA
jgi:three-Cys-motif partner protein